MARRGAILVETSSERVLLPPVALSHKESADLSVPFAILSLVVWGLIRFPCLPEEAL